MRSINEPRVDDLDIDDLVPWARVVRAIAFGRARLRFLRPLLRSLLTPIVHRRLSVLSQDPIRSIQAVGEASRREALTSLYASVLQTCIRKSIWACWREVFRLDGFATEGECEDAVRAFASRWTHDGMPPNAPNEDGLADARREDVPPTKGLDWIELIRALYVLHFYERTDCGLRDFALIMQTVRGLFARVHSDEPEMTSDQRKVLVRYAIHFDYLEKAMEFAAGGGDAMAFERKLLAEYRRCTDLNSQRLSRLVGAPTGMPHSVIGSLVWGKSFIDNFLNYHVPSLLAPGNIPALVAKRRVIWSIVTTEPDRAIMLANPIFRSLSDQVQVEFTCFDKSLIDECEQAGFNFYWFYGMLDHVSIDLARKAAAGIFLLPPDTILSQSFLSTLNSAIEGGADCCSVGYIEAEKGGLLKALDVRRHQDGHIALEGSALLDLAACHMTNHFRSLIMDIGNISFCRHPRELIWPIEGGFVMHALFVHPVAISARVMSRPFHPNYENVDYALMPRILQDDGKLAVIQDATRATAAHFSPLERAGAYADGGFSLRRFLAAHDHDYSVHRESFGQPVLLPCISPGHLASRVYDEEYRIIRSALKRGPYRQVLDHVPGALLVKT